MTTIERFLSKVIKGAGCWSWIGTFVKDRDGRQRPMFWLNGQNRLATRVAWELFKDPIPVDKMLCHTCDNAACINWVAHLYVGDQSTNMWDRKVRGRTSRWDKRPNFVQTPELEEKVKAMRMSGERIEDICAKLNIGRTTYYRLRARGVIPSDREISRTNYRIAAKAR